MPISEGAEMTLLWNVIIIAMSEISVKNKLLVYIQLTKHVYKATVYIHWAKTCLYKERRKA